MKKIYFSLFLLFTFTSVFAQLAGTTWKIAPTAQALAVGPTQGDFSWWSNSAGDVTTRACFFDDQFVFEADGTFRNVQDGETWLEGWQGIDSEGCGASVAPHDGSNAATWAFDEAAGTVTLTGVGAHLGLAKVHNNGELTSPADAPASITYPVVIEGNTMTIDINFGGGFWHFVFEQVVTTDPEPEPEPTSALAGAWRIAPMAQALAVGPTMGDFSWWSNSAGDVTTRACFFDDQFVFEADGTFRNVQDGETWLEGWQGMDPEGCGASVAPHDGSNAATWAFDEAAGTVTLTGVGAHLGLAKVHNGGELTSPADAVESITYPVVIDGNTMTIDIDFGGIGFWHFVLERVTDGGVDPEPVVDANVTFGVDMNGFSEAFTQVYLSGSLNGWSGDANPLSDEDGDGIWWITLPLSAADYEYKFTLDNWAVQEEFAEGESCTITTDGFTNRIITVADADAEVCFNWNSCSVCGTEPEPEPETTDVTFGVDMNSYTGTFTQVYLSGSLNGWSGDANPLADEDGDGIWTAVVPLVAGDYDYKFTVDNWADQEQFAGGEACTGIFGDNGEFVNRVITVGEAASEVCFMWNSCDACGTGNGGGEEPMGIAGAWRVAPMAGALAVGPTMGDFSWWSNAAADVQTRACFFDDQYVFNEDGTFNNVQDGETWLEPWQGVDPEGCGASIAPHDGSNAATWTFDEAASTITLNGLGAYLGLAKVHNGGELASPADAVESITYPVVIDGNTMTIDIDFGGIGFWHFVLERVTDGGVDPEPVVDANVTFGVDMNGFSEAFTQVYLSGSLNGWSGDANPLSDEDGDGIWWITLPLSAADYEYKFTLDNWAVQEEFAEGESCTITTDGFTNRIITIGADDAEVCFNWNTCDVCGTPIDGGGGEAPMGVVGTWRLAPMAQALAVGPTMGDFSWWSNSAADVTTRACLFDDQFVFEADGTFRNVQDGETWLEAWQGMDPEGCGASLAPHDGSNAATWTLDEAAGELTLTGVGAHLGLAKVHNGGELTSPADAPASITYPVVIEGNTMTVDINFGGTGFWHFVLERAAITSTVEIAEEALFNFFPNPANAQIQIQSEEAIDELTIHDITGKVLMRRAKPSSNETVDVSGLTSGLYIIQVRVGHKISVEKLSIN